MRYLKHYILIITFLLTYVQPKAQTKFYGKIDKFEVLSQYLVNGQIKLSNEAYTEIKYKVGFVREFRTLTPPTWMPFDLTVRLSTSTDQGDIILFDSPHNITLAKFKKNDVFLDTILTSKIDNSKVNKSRSIILSYIRDKQSFPNMSFEGKSYLIEQNASPNPGPGPDLEPIVKADSIPFYSLFHKNGGYSLSDKKESTGAASRGDAFYAFNKRVKGSKRVNGWIRINQGKFPGLSSVYTFDQTNYGQMNFKNLGSFYAFDNQVKGTVPVYRYTNSSGTYYTTIPENRNDTTPPKIAFFAYPSSIPPPPIDPRPLRPKPIVNNFTIEPTKWLNADDGKFSVALSSIIPHKEILKVQFFEILAGLKPGGPNGDYMETIMLPASFKNNEYSYELANGEIIISLKNSNKTRPSENLNLSIQYLDGTMQ